MTEPCSNPNIAVILAGGEASRFGGDDKGEILINNKRLIDIILKRLEPQVSGTIISGTHDYGLGLEAVPDSPNAPGGPVGGLYSIWTALKPKDIEGFFTVPVDGPNLPLDLTSRLYDSGSSSIAVDNQGRHPTYGWWRMKDLSQAWEAIDLARSISLNNLADRIDAKDVIWQADDGFMNINRKSDLERLV